MMNKVLKLSGVAGSLLVAGTMISSAAVIDFTVGLPGSTSGSNWTASATDSFGAAAVPTVSFGGPGAQTVDTSLGFDMSSLAGDNDGFGVMNDEISAPGNNPNKIPQTVTITFNKKVKLRSAYYLDLFLNSTGTDSEFANILVDGVASGVPVFGAVVPTSEGVGLGEQTGLSLNGYSFTFFASPSNDGVGQPDFALAGLEISAVPLPAGFLLLGTALGGLGVARRRKKKA